MDVAQDFVEQEDASRPKKRQKRPSAEDETNDAKARQNKACAHCRKLKVKCDSGEEQTTCSRCHRLGLTCLREKKSWSLPNEDDAWQNQLTITKLERALEDILERLDMPALDLYVSPAIVKQKAPPRPTRPNSEERGEKERDVSPDPMNSLIEATQLNGLRSQLRSVKQRRKGGMRRMDHDMIAEKIISMEEAEELLNVFKQSQAQYLFSATIPSDATVKSIRSSSTVLFTAIMLVTALQTEGREALHEACHQTFMGLVSDVMFDRFHSLDDIRGLVIAAFWQPYLSWKLSGLSVRMATELNLHHAFYEAFHEPSLSVEARKDCLEKARLWYLLYVLDHMSSITFGRPACMSEMRPIKDLEMLLTSDYCSSADRALVAQVQGLVVLSRAFDHFGLEPKREMAGDDASVLNHMRFTEDMYAWCRRWTTHHSTGESYLRQSVQLNYHFSNLILNSLVLRGRALDKISELPASLRTLALKAVEAAHEILHHFVSEPSYRESLAGMPLYLHSMIAFAVVFLMKMSRRWHVIGITVSASERTIPLIEEIVLLLQGCKAGANHMVFKMAKGFERMLRQLKANDRSGITEHILPQKEQYVHWNGSQDQPMSQMSYNLDFDQPQHNPQAALQATMASNGFGGQATAPIYDPTMQGANNTGVSPETTGSRMSFANWGFQDDDFWQVGMGWDLLDPSGSGPASASFNSGTFWF